jgi:hypothetical protein
VSGDERMMSWCWLALVREPPDGATAAVPVWDEHDTPAGELAAWTRRAKPLREARRMDARGLDPEGAEAFVSLVLPPPGVRLLFDDPAVQHARRALLAGPPPDFISTLLRDASHFEGSITVRRGADAPDRLREDPFARVFGARILRVGAGLIGKGPAPAGPTIERYGSAQPWPWDRFLYG